MLAYATKVFAATVEEFAQLMTGLLPVALAKVTRTNWSLPPPSALVIPDPLHPHPPPPLGLVSYAHNTAHVKEEDSFYARRLRTAVSVVAGRYSVYLLY